MANLFIAIPHKSAIESYALVAITEMTSHCIEVAIKNFKRNADEDDFDWGDMFIVSKRVVVKYSYIFEAGEEERG